MKTYLFVTDNNKSINGTVRYDFEMVIGLNVLFLPVTFAQ